jgi:pteridine reductase
MTNTSVGEGLEGVALVTGAARRVGAAIVRELHEAGMNVVIHYRGSADEARALAAQLNARRPRSACALRADLGAVTQLQRLAERAHAQWGRLDALVNNASSYYATPFGSITEAAFDELIGSNFKSPLFLAQACLPYFGERAAIVNVIDTLARHAQPRFAPYAAAKAALWSLTETLAVELAPHVRVNAIAPGHILWPEAVDLSAAQKKKALAQVPLRRIGEADDIAQSVRFLLSPSASYVTGVILPVAGGLGLI